MNVAEAIEVATEWVGTYAAQTPGFRGAHLMGSITTLPRDAEFPSDGDLDLNILVQDAPPFMQNILEDWYRELAIEAGLKGVEVYGLPEAVLANPELACHLAVDSIIADPSGLLGRIQPIIAREYALRRWVTARCQDEKARVLWSLEQAGQASTPREFAFHETSVILNLSGLLAVALLRPPTHRKCLVLLRDLLRQQDRAELYDEALAVCGFAHWSETEVSAYLERSAHAFDRAIEVKRTPVLFDFKLRPHLRHYFVDGLRPMIVRGEHREALVWIFVSLYISTAVLGHDAPEGERAAYDLLWREFIHHLGLDTPTSWRDRLQRAAALKVALFVLADEIVARRPDTVEGASPRLTETTTAE